MIKRIAIIISIMFALTPLAKAQGFMPMLGAYVDTFTGISGKGGVAYSFSSLEEAEDSSFLIYSDVEFGTKAYKITLGPAYSTGLLFSRVGVSYAKKDSNEYIGVEALYFAVLLSFKFGIYADPDSDGNIVTAGFGIGF